MQSKDGVTSCIFERGPLSYLWNGTGSRYETSIEGYQSIIP